MFLSEAKIVRLYWKYASKANKHGGSHNAPSEVFLLDGRIASEKSFLQTFPSTDAINFQDRR